MTNFKRPVKPSKRIEDETLNWDALEGFLVVGTYGVQAVAPSAQVDTAIVYAQLAGGKVKLLVRMPTGSPIQLAIEP